VAITSRVNSAKAAVERRSRSIARSRREVTFAKSRHHSNKYVDHDDNYMRVVNTGECLGSTLLHSGKEEEVAVEDYKGA
jgi:hypothetical protein